jgi:hypothetical protein
VDASEESPPHAINACETTTLATPLAARPSTKSLAPSTSGASFSRSFLRLCPFDPFVSVSHTVTTFPAAVANVVRECARQASKMS